MCVRARRRTLSSIFTSDWLVKLLPGLFFCLLNCGEHSINVETKDVGDRSLTVDKDALEAFFGPTLFNGPTFFSVRHPTGRPPVPAQKKARLGSDAGAEGPDV